jgi:hypothetical protein
MASHFGRGIFPQRPVPPPQIAQAAAIAPAAGRNAVPPPPTRFGGTVQRQAVSGGPDRVVPPPPTRFGAIIQRQAAPGGTGRLVAPPPPIPAGSAGKLHPAPRSAKGAAGAPVLQRAATSSNLLLEVKEDSVSYGSSSAGSTRYSYIKDGPAAKPTLPKVKGDMDTVPKLPKGAEAAAFQIVTLTTDGPNIDGSYVAYSSDRTECRFRRSRPGIPI